MPPNMPSAATPLTNNILRFVKLTDKAYTPTKGSISAAGFDLRSAYEYVVPAMGKELIKTDLQIEVPLGTYGRVAPRSGLAWKNQIDVGAGVIDADYRCRTEIAVVDVGMHLWHTISTDWAQRSFHRDFHSTIGSDGQRFYVRGNIGVILFNHSKEEFVVHPGDRVAQLICEKIVYPDLQEVETLETTLRGAGGFGSTGVN